MSMAEFDSIKVKDQLGPPDDKNFTPKRFVDILIIEDNVSEIRKSTLGNSWIVGSATNGIVGANTNTQNGLQQVVGSANRLSFQKLIISSDGNYREHFRDTYFKDSTNTTANWNTTSFRVSLS